MKFVEKVRRPLVLAVLGVVPLVYVIIPLLTVSYPGFSWVEQPLSDLGVTGENTAWAFNGTMIVFGVLAAAFVSVVAVESETRLERIGATLIGLGYVFAALVGVFPTPHPLHDLVTLSMYLSGVVGLYVRGTGNITANDRKIGLVAIWLGILSPWIWLVWITLMGFDSGLAIPEYIAGLTVDVWLVLEAARTLRGTANRDG